MLKSTHFGACSDAVQQVHGAGVKSNGYFALMVKLVSAEKVKTDFKTEMD